MRLLLALLLLALVAAPAQAAKLAVAFDEDVILEADDADRLWHPASLTKLMTAYLAFEALALGHLEWGQELKVSKTAGQQPEVALGLSQGDSITVGKAIEAMLLRSANDAAVVLAEAIDGSHERFALRMTETARRLGMTRSVFVNANGLPDDRQVTTARDMAILARALLVDLPQRYDLFSKGGLSHGQSWLANINGILNSLAGADGLKTGFTCKSGYNLVVSAERDGQRVIGVILGARSPDQRRDQAHALMERAFRTLQREPEDLASLRRPQSGLPLMTGPVAPPDLENEGPPTVLTPADCIYGAALRQARGPWAIHVGNFRTYGLASRKMRSLRRLTSALGFSQQRIFRAKAVGAARFQARFVNLKRSEAQRACRTLQSNGHYCRVVPPRSR
ncbi:MAG: D-alanyl-D-alanine carboxypeptidase family protein [Pseudomonadota bacterium]